MAELAKPPIPCPLSLEDQIKITPAKLAGLVLWFLCRNAEVSGPNIFAISYYPFQLSSIKAFEIIGHTNSEDKSFADKWSEAITLLSAKAHIMPDPSQEYRRDFMKPTTIGKQVDIAAEYWK